MGIFTEINYIYSDPDRSEKLIDYTIIILSILLSYMLSMKLILDAYISAASLLPVYFKYIPISTVKATVLSKVPALVYLTFKRNMMEYLFPFAALSVFGPLTRLRKIIILRPYLDLRARFNAFRLIVFLLIATFLSEIPLIIGLIGSLFYYYIQGSLFYESYLVLEIQLFVVIITGFISGIITVLTNRLELGVILSLITIYVLIQVLWKFPMILLEVLGFIAVVLVLILFIVERWRLTKIA